MDEKNQQALALAFKRAKAKSLKIKELKIVPAMNEDLVDALIIKLSKVKAKEDNKKWETLVKGQRWYIEDLVEFSGLNAQQRMDLEYANAFPDTAEEGELLSALEDFM